MVRDGKGWLRLLRMDMDVKVSWGGYGWLRLVRDG